MQMKDVIDATGARQVRQSRDTGGRIFFKFFFRKVGVMRMNEWESRDDLPNPQLRRSRSHWLV